MPTACASYCNSVTSDRPLHQQIGLRVVSELEDVAADLAETVLFVKPLRTRIILPDAEPHNVVGIFDRKLKAGVHQILPDAFANVLLM